MNYHERLKELNNLEGKTIWDSIDRPIRPLIYELNRVGLSTKFCCCGFSYDGEEEPKTHAKLTFVVLNPLAPPVAAISAFFALAKVSVINGWKLMPYSGNGEWHLSFKHTDDFYNRGNDVGIHDYEVQLINILQMTNVIKEWPTFKEEFEIIDGNSKYSVLGGEWQVKAKDPVKSADIKKDADGTNTINTLKS